MELDNFYQSLCAWQKLKSAEKLSRNSQDTPIYTCATRAPSCGRLHEACALNKAFEDEGYKLSDNFTSVEDSAGEGGADGVERCAQVCSTAETCLSLHPGTSLLSVPDVTPPSPQNFHASVRQPVLDSRNDDVFSAIRPTSEVIKQEPEAVTCRTGQNSARKIEPGCSPFMISKFTADSESSLLKGKLLCGPDFCCHNTESSDVSSASAVCTLRASPLNITEYCRSRCSASDESLLCPSLPRSSAQALHNFQDQVNRSSSGRKEPDICSNHGKFVERISSDLRHAGDVGRGREKSKDLCLCCRAIGTTISSYTEEKATLTTTLASAAYMTDPQGKVITDVDTEALTISNYAHYIPGQEHTLENSRSDGCILNQPPVTAVCTELSSAARHGTRSIGTVIGANQLRPVVTEISAVCAPSSNPQQALYKDNSSGVVVKPVFDWLDEGRTGITGFGGRADKQSRPVVFPCYSVEDQVFVNAIQLNNSNSDISVGVGCSRGDDVDHVGGTTPGSAAGVNAESPRDFPVAVNPTRFTNGRSISPLLALCDISKISPSPNVIIPDVICHFKDFHSEISSDFCFTSEFPEDLRPCQRSGSEVKPGTGDFLNYVREKCQESNFKKVINGLRFAHSRPRCDAVYGHTLCSEREPATRTSTQYCSHFQNVWKAHKQWGCVDYQSSTSSSKEHCERSDVTELENGGLTSLDIFWPPSDDVLIAEVKDSGDETTVKNNDNDFNRDRCAITCESSVYLEETCPPAALRHSFSPPASSPVRTRTDETGIAWSYCANPDSFLCSSERDLAVGEGKCCSSSCPSCEYSLSQARPELSRDTTAHEFLSHVITANVLRDPRSSPTSLDTNYCTSRDGEKYCTNVQTQNYETSGLEPDPRRSLNALLPGCQHLAKDDSIFTLSDTHVNKRISGGNASKLTGKKCYTQITNTLSRNELISREQTHQNVKTKSPGSGNQITLSNKISNSHRKDGFLQGKASSVFTTSKSKAGKDISKCGQDKQRPESPCRSVNSIAHRTSCNDTERRPTTPLGASKNVLHCPRLSRYVNREHDLSIVDKRSSPNCKTESVSRREKGHFIPGSNNPSGKLREISSSRSTTPESRVLVRQTRASLLRQCQQHRGSHILNKNLKLSSGAVLTKGRGYPIVLEEASLTRLKSNREQSDTPISLVKVEVSKVMADGSSKNGPKLTSKLQTSRTIHSTDSSSTDKNVFRVQTQETKVNFRKQESGKLCTESPKMTSKGSRENISAPKNSPGFLKQTQSQLSKIKSPSTPKVNTSGESQTVKRRTQDGADKSTKASIKSSTRSKTSLISSTSTEATTDEATTEEATTDEATSEKTQIKSQLLRRASRKENICSDSVASCQSPRIRKKLSIMGLTSPPEVLSPLASPTQSENSVNSLTSHSDKDVSFSGKEFTAQDTSQENIQCETYHEFSVKRQSKSKSPPREFGISNASTAPSNRQKSRPPCPSLKVGTLTSIETMRSVKPELTKATSGTKSTTSRSVTGSSTVIPPPPPPSSSSLSILTIPSSPSSSLSAQKLDKSSQILKSSQSKSFLPLPHRLQIKCANTNPSTKPEVSADLTPDGQDTSERDQHEHKKFYHENVQSSCVCIESSVCQICHEISRQETVYPEDVHVTQGVGEGCVTAAALKGSIPINTAAHVMSGEETVPSISFKSQHKSRDDYSSAENVSEEPALETVGEFSREELVNYSRTDSRETLDDLTDTDGLFSCTTECNDDSEKAIDESSIIEDKNPDSDKMDEKGHERVQNAFSCAGNMSQLNKGVKVNENIRTKGPGFSRQENQKSSLQGNPNSGLKQRQCCNIKKTGTSFRTQQAGSKPGQLSRGRTTDGSAEVGGQTHGAKSIQKKASQVLTTESKLPRKETSKNMDRKISEVTDSEETQEKTSAARSDISRRLQGLRYTPQRKTLSASSSSSSSLPKMKSTSSTRESSVDSRFDDDASSVASDLSSMTSSSVSSRERSRLGKREDRTLKPTLAGEVHKRCADLKLKQTTAHKNKPATITSSACSKSMSRRPAQSVRSGRENNNSGESIGKNPPVPAMKGERNPTLKRQSQQTRGSSAREITQIEQMKCRKEAETAEGDGACAEAAEGETLNTISSCSNENSGVKVTERGGNKPRLPVVIQPHENINQVDVTIQIINSDQEVLELMDGNDLNIARGAKMERAGVIVNEAEDGLESAGPDERKMESTVGNMNLIHNSDTSHSEERVNSVNDQCNDAFPSPACKAETHINPLSSTRRHSSRAPYAMTHQSSALSPVDVSPMSTIQIPPSLCSKEAGGGGGTQTSREQGECTGMDSYQVSECEQETERGLNLSRADMRVVAARSSNSTQRKDHGEENCKEDDNNEESSCESKLSYLLPHVSSCGVIEREYDSSSSLLCSQYQLVCEGANEFPYCDGKNLSDFHGISKKRLLGKETQELGNICHGNCIVIERVHEDDTQILANFSRENDSEAGTVLLSEAHTDLTLLSPRTPQNESSTSLNQTLRPDCCSARKLLPRHVTKASSSNSCGPGDLDGQIKTSSRRDESLKIRICGQDDEIHRRRPQNTNKIEDWDAQIIEEKIDVFVDIRNANLAENNENMQFKESTDEPVWNTLVGTGFRSDESSQKFIPDNLCGRVKDNRDRGDDNTTGRDFLCPLFHENTPEDPYLNEDYVVSEDYQGQHGNEDTDSDSADVALSSDVVQFSGVCHGSSHTKSFSESSDGRSGDTVSYGTPPNSSSEVRDGGKEEKAEDVEEEPRMTGSSRSRILQDSSDYRSAFEKVVHLQSTYKRSDKCGDDFIDDFCELSSADVVDDSEDVSVDVDDDATDNDDANSESSFQSATSDLLMAAVTHTTEELALFEGCGTSKAGEGMAKLMASDSESLEIACWEDAHHISYDSVDTAGERDMNTGGCTSEIKSLSPKSFIPQVSQKQKQRTRRISLDVQPQCYTSENLPSATSGYELFADSTGNVSTISPTHPVSMMVFHRSDSQSDVMSQNQTSTVCGSRFPRAVSMDEMSRSGDLLNSRHQGIIRRLAVDDTSRGSTRKIGERSELRVAADSRPHSAPHPLSFSHDEEVNSSAVFSAAVIKSENSFAGVIGKTSPPSTTTLFSSSSSSTQTLREERKSRQRQVTKGKAGSSPMARSSSVQPARSTKIPMYFTRRSPSPSIVQKNGTPLLQRSNLDRIQNQQQENCSTSASQLSNSSLDSSFTCAAGNEVTKQKGTSAMNLSSSASSGECLEDQKLPDSCGLCEVVLNREEACEQHVRRTDLISGSQNRPFPGLSPSRPQGCFHQLDPSAGRSPADAVLKKHEKSPEKCQRPQSTGYTDKATAKTSIEASVKTSVKTSADDQAVNNLETSTTKPSSQLQKTTNKATKPDKRGTKTDTWSKYVEPTTVGDEQEGHCEQPHHTAAGTGSDSMTSSDEICSAHVSPRKQNTASELHSYLLSEKGHLSAQEDPRNCDRTKFEGDSLQDYMDVYEYRSLHQEAQDIRTSLFESGYSSDIKSPDVRSPVQEIEDAHANSIQMVATDAEPHLDKSYKVRLSPVCFSGCLDFIKCSQCGSLNFKDTSKERTITELSLSSSSSETRFDNVGSIIVRCDECMCLKGEQSKTSVPDLRTKTHSGGSAVKSQIYSECIRQHLSPWCRDNLEVSDKHEAEVNKLKTSGVQSSEIPACTRLDTRSLVRGHICHSVSMDIRPACDDAISDKQCARHDSDNRVGTEKFNKVDNGYSMIDNDYSMPGLEYNNTFENFITRVQEEDTNSSDSDTLRDLMNINAAKDILDVSKTYLQSGKHSGGAIKEANGEDINKIPFLIDNSVYNSDNVYFAHFVEEEDNLPSFPRQLSTRKTTNLEDCLSLNMDGKEFGSSLHFSPILVSSAAGPKLSARSQNGCNTVSSLCSQDSTFLMLEDDCGHHFITDQVEEGTARAVVHDSDCKGGSTSLGNSATHRALLSASTACSEHSMKEREENFTTGVGACSDDICIRCCRVETELTEEVKSDDRCDVGRSDVVAESKGHFVDSEVMDNDNSNGDGYNVCGESVDQTCRYFPEVSADSSSSSSSSSSSFPVCSKHSITEETITEAQEHVSTSLKPLPDSSKQLLAGTHLLSSNDHRSSPNPVCWAPKAKTGQNTYDLFVNSPHAVSHEHRNNEKCSLDIMAGEEHLGVQKSVISVDGMERNRKDSVDNSEKCRHEEDDKDDSRTLVALQDQDKIVPHDDDRAEITSGASSCSRGDYLERKEETNDRSQLMGKMNSSRCRHLQEPLTGKLSLLVDLHTSNTKGDVNVSQTLRKPCPSPHSEGPPKEKSPIILEIVCELLSKVSYSDHRSYSRSKSLASQDDTARLLSSSRTLTSEEKTRANGARVINKWRSMVKRSRVMAIRESLKAKLSGNEDNRSLLPPPVSPSPPRKYKWARSESGIWKKVYLDENDKDENEPAGHVNMSSSDPFVFSSSDVCDHLSQNSATETEEDNGDVKTAVYNENSYAQDGLVLSASTTELSIPSSDILVHEGAKENQCETITCSYPADIQQVISTSSGDIEFVENEGDKQVAEMINSMEPSDNRVIIDESSKQDGAKYDEIMPGECPLQRFSSEDGRFKTPCELMEDEANEKILDSGALESGVSADHVMTSRHIDPRSRPIDENGKCDTGKVTEDEMEDKESVAPGAGTTTSARNLWKRAGRETPTSQNMEDAGYCGLPESYSNHESVYGTYFNSSKTANGDMCRAENVTSAVNCSQILLNDVGSQIHINCGGKYDDYSCIKMAASAGDWAHADPAEMTTSSTETGLPAGINAQYDASSQTAIRQPRDTSFSDEYFIKDHKTTIERSESSLIKEHEDIPQTKNQEFQDLVSAIDSLLASHDEDTDTETVASEKTAVVCHNKGRADSASSYTAPYRTKISQPTSQKNKLLSASAERNRNTAQTKNGPYPPENSKQEISECEKNDENSKREANDDKKAKKYTWPTVAESLKRFQKSIAGTQATGHLHRGREQLYFKTIRKDTVPFRPISVDGKEKPAVDQETSCYRNPKSADGLSPLPCVYAEDRASTTVMDASSDNTMSVAETKPAMLNNPINSCNDSFNDTPQTTPKTQPQTGPKFKTSNKSDVNMTFKFSSPTTRLPLLKTSRLDQSNFIGSHAEPEVGVGKDNLPVCPPTSTPETSTPVSPVLTLTQYSSSPGRTLPGLETRSGHFSTEVSGQFSAEASGQFSTEVDADTVHCHLNNSRLSSTPGKSEIMQNDVPECSLTARVTVEHPQHKYISLSSSLSSSSSSSSASQNHQLEEQGLPYDNLLQGEIINSIEDDTEPTAASLTTNTSAPEVVDETVTYSPDSGTRRHTPSAKLISVSVWDTYDGCKTLKCSRRLWAPEEVPTLAGISEIEEAQAVRDSSPGKSSDLDINDSTRLQASSECKERVRASRSPVRPYSKKKKAPRRSLSLPTGGLSYGDVKILYRDGHFVMVDTSAERAARCAAAGVLENVTEEYERPDHSAELQPDGSPGKDGSDECCDAESKVRAEILSLLERRITDPQGMTAETSLGFDSSDSVVGAGNIRNAAPVFLSLPRRKGHRPVSMDETGLWKYYSKSQQSLASQAEMDKQVEAGRQAEGTCTGVLGLKRNSSFTAALGSSTMLSEADDRSDISKNHFGSEACDGGFDEANQKQDVEDSQNSKSRTKGPGFLQRILQKRKNSVSERTSSSSLSTKSQKSDLTSSSLSLASTSSTSHQHQISADKHEKQDVSLGRKMSFKAIFKRKNSTDTCVRKSSEEPTSPSTVRVPDNEDTRTTSPPIDSHRYLNQNLAEDDLLREGLVGAEEVNSFCQLWSGSRSPRTPLSNSSSHSSLYRSLSQDDSECTPIASQTDGISHRARSASGRKRSSGGASPCERLSGDSFSEYDFSSLDHHNSDGTTSPRSVSPGTADLLMEEDKTLVASPTLSDRLSPPDYNKQVSSPQHGQRRVSREGETFHKSPGTHKDSSMTTSNRSMEIISRNSNDSGIQNDANVNSSAESIQAAVKLRKSKSPSPTTERPKSDTTVRWADLLEQVMEPSGVRYRKDANKLRRKPRPASDIDEKLNDEGLEDEESYEDVEKEDGEDEDKNEGDRHTASARRALLMNATSMGNITATTTVSTNGPVPSAVGTTSSFSDVRALMQSRESLLSFVELRRSAREGSRDAVSARLAKIRRLSTPQPITVRAEKPKTRPVKPACGSGVLAHAHSMPDNLDRLKARRKNYFSLIGSDAQSITSQQSVDDEDSSDESEFSVGYHTERSHSARSSHIMLTALDQMLGEEHFTFAEALWDHVTMDPDELGFRAGDLIRVQDATDKHWWLGVLDDNEGWFPASFVRLRVNQDVMQEELAFFLAEEEAAVVAGHAGSVVTSSAYMGKSQARSNVVNEIISAEKEYVKHLRDVVEGYVKQARKRPEMFPIEKVTVIFSNIEEIYAFATELLTELEQAVNHDQPHLSELGQCFLDKVKGFEMYSDYCNNHSAACEELRELYRNKRYRHFFEACRLLQEMIEIPLEGFLLTPVQKICKYHLQLAELLKFTPPDHPDFSRVQGALEAMKKMAMLINERKRKMESVEKLAAWQLLVDDWQGPDILEGSSELIYSGELNKINHAGWSQERYFFLFDHQLVYCKKDLLKKSSFGFKGRIDMDSCQVISIPDGRDSQYNVNVRNAWKLHETSSDKWYLLVAKTTVAKQRWLKAFQDERRRVKEDTENNFNIPNHVKQAVITNFKQKTSLNKPKGKGKLIQPNNTAEVINTFNSVNAIATLPRNKNRHKVKADGTVGKIKKINWFFLSKGKS